MSSVPVLVRLLPCALCVVAALGASLTIAKPAPPPVSAADAFLKSLTPELKAQATFAIDADERYNWHFVPLDNRKGVPLMAMSEPQKEAALALLSSCLSQQGYQRVRTIRDLENVLLQMEHATTAFRNPDKYYFTVFGTPTASGAWGWRFEGHHVALNWSLSGNKVVASTPQFFGTNPAQVPAGLPMAGTRALAAEEDLGRALVLALTDAQRAEAVISPKAPNDILTGAERVAAIQEDKGIAYKSLTGPQKKQLVALIDAHAAVQTQTVAKQRLAAIRKAGLDSVKFAWMGSTEPRKGHYYRVQGPTFLIEYDNTQNDANHIHSAWRDFTGDFGRAQSAEGYGEDVLAEHGRADHPPR